MGYLTADLKGQSNILDLQVVLRTTLSLLKNQTPYIVEDGSLRNLELAIMCAITDLEQVELRKQDPNVCPIPIADPKMQPAHSDKRL